jgi:TolB protein
MIRFLLRLSLLVSCIAIFTIVGALLVGRILPSSGHLAYYALDSRTVRLWVLDPARNLAWAIADHGFTGVSLFPSPDGQQIAFFREEDGNTELHIINADGSMLRRLPEITPDLAVAWLPNNTEVVISSAYGTNSRHNVYDFSRTTLPRFGDSSCGLPALSPDGQRVASTLSESGGSFFCRNNGIGVMNADGTGALVEFLPAEFDLSPVWSPDGRRLALYGPGGLYLATDHVDVPIDQLLQTGLYSSFARPVWSPDGTQIALVMGGQFDVYLVPMSAEVANLTASQSMELYPTWSPDGTEIAFTSNREDGTEIYVMNVSSGALRRVTYNVINELSLVWLP